MRRSLFAFLLLSLSISSFAGSKKITKDVIAFWSDRTEPIEYNSYAVEIKLSGPIDFNVSGTVYLDEQSKPIYIEAGKTRQTIYFDNLSNQRRYDIIVKLNECTSFPKTENKAFISKKEVN